MARTRGNQGSKGIGFFGMVAATMAALKLKDKWDEYRRLPSEEDGVGPVALHSPTEEEGLSMDTEIPTVRPRRKRDCCVCCGLKCGLFWKAFGIVCLVLVGWQTIKFIFWMLTPSPTGLEDMPAFSTSLGCVNAPHVYGGSQATYVVPVGLGADHSIDIKGAAVGTLVVAQGAFDATEIKYEMTLRSDDASLLDQVSLSYPTSSEIEEGLSQSRFHLNTPLPGPSACIRYDMTVYVPPTVKNLTIEARSVAQLKFDGESNIDLDSLRVQIYSLDARNMILPHKGVHASELAFELDRGWLVGDVAIVDTTTLTTSRGDAAMNVHVFPAPSAAEPPAVAELQTSTGAGRADVFYVNHPGHPHRPISSVHRGTRGGDLYLTYSKAEFKGTVDLTAKSFSAKGLQGAIRHVNGELPWVGDREGGDKIVASAPNGWIGIYF